MPQVKYEEKYFQEWAPKHWRDTVPIQAFRSSREIFLHMFRETLGDVHDINVVIPQYWISKIRTQTRAHLNKKTINTDGALTLLAAAHFLPTEQIRIIQKRVKKVLQEGYLSFDEKVPPILVELNELGYERRSYDNEETTFLQFLGKLKDQKLQSTQLVYAFLASLEHLKPKDIEDINACTESALSFATQHEYENTLTTRTHAWRAEAALKICGISTIEEIVDEVAYCKTLDDAIVKAIEGSIHAIEPNELSVPANVKMTIIAAAFAICTNSKALFNSYKDGLDSLAQHDKYKEIVSTLRRLKEGRGFIADEIFWEDEEEFALEEDNGSDYGSSSPWTTLTFGADSDEESESNDSFLWDEENYEDEEDSGDEDQL